MRGGLGTSQRMGCGGTGATPKGGIEGNGGTLWDARDGMEGEGGTPEGGEKGDRSTLGHGMEGDGRDSRGCREWGGGDCRGWDGTWGPQEMGGDRGIPGDGKEWRGTGDEVEKVEGS